MTEQLNEAVVADEQMRGVLEVLLANDDDITARAVARLHPAISAASSITRSPARSRLLAEYQERQAQYRRWRGRVSHNSAASAASSLADKDIRIAELETTVQLLTASHLALVRTVGEMGGFAKWAKFYEHHQAARDRLVEIGAIPTAPISALPKSPPRRP